MTANPDRTLLSAYRESPAGKEECSVRIGDKNEAAGAAVAAAVADE
jgi:hypothetical protein